MYQSFKDHLQTGSQRPGVCDGKDSANRMQSSSLELLRCSLFSLISSANKIRHNILKEDGFEIADPEISRVFPSFPEFSRVIPRRAKKKHQNFCVLMLLLLSSPVYLI